MNRQRFLLPALLVLTLARFLLLPLHELSELENYVRACGDSPDLWHTGLGPLLPLLVKLSTLIFGDGAFAVRLWAPLLILGASWLFWELGNGLFDANKSSWALVVFHITPAVNLASVTITPLTMGIVSSVAVLAALRLALHRQSKHHFYWWMLGLTLVYAFMADWRLLALSVSAAGSLALTSRGRRAATKWPVLPLLCGCMGLAVTLFFAWNSEHGWPAWQPVGGILPSGLLPMLLQALLAYGPILLAAFIWAIARAASHRPRSYEEGFLYAFIWPAFLLDILAWRGSPWPQAGLGAWLPPACLLLAHLAMSEQALPPRWSLLTRALVLFCAAVQSIWLLSGELVRWVGLEW